jgi:protein arginine kinase
MEQSDQSMLIMNKVDDSCLHINDHDHIRIITIAPGLQLESAYAAADAIDNDLNQFIPYAFSDDLGYLSPMISNIGTGMKVSIAAHLPALSMNNHISDMIQPLRNNGFELLGNVSDSIKSKGDIYVISNKTKLGISESECIIRLGSMIRDIIEAEDDEREALYSDSKNEIEDMVFRSYGILTNARSISHKEAMQLLSLLRMGVLLAFFKNIDIAAINNLMVQIQPAHIQSFYGMSFNDKRECDEIRADFIRSEIGNFEVM